MRRITEIIIHCSATPEGKDFTVEDIRRWHLARHFADIGYHYVVYRNGSVHKGRAENIAGAHCLGHNANSIGICYIGGVAKDGKRPRIHARHNRSRHFANSCSSFSSFIPMQLCMGTMSFQAKLAHRLTFKQSYEAFCLSHNHVAVPTHFVPQYAQSHKHEHVCHGLRCTGAAESVANVTH